MSDDAINAMFQAVAALMILDNVRALYRDKEVRGVSILSTVFFFIYGVWNLRYYPMLGQWWSFAAGVLVTLANCLCVGMMVYYSYFYSAQANKSFSGLKRKRDVSTLIFRRLKLERKPLTNSLPWLDTAPVKLAISRRNIEKRARALS